MTRVLRRVSPQPGNLWKIRHGVTTFVREQ